MRIYLSSNLGSLAQLRQMTLAVLAELSEMTHFVRQQIRVAGLYISPFYGQHIMATKMFRIDRLVFAMTTSRKGLRLMKRSHPLVLLSLIAAVAAASVNATPTYHRDVLPIHCEPKTVNGLSIEPARRQNRSHIVEIWSQNCVHTFALRL